MSQGPIRLISGSEKPTVNPQQLEDYADKVMALYDEMHGAVATLSISLALARICANLCDGDRVTSAKLAREALDAALEYELVDAGLHPGTEKYHGENTEPR